MGHECETHTAMYMCMEWSKQCATDGWMDGLANTTPSLSLCLSASGPTSVGGALLCHLCVAGIPTHPSCKDGLALQPVDGRTVGPTQTQRSIHQSPHTCCAVHKESTDEREREREREDALCVLDDKVRNRAACLPGLLPPPSDLWVCVAPHTLTAKTNNTSE